MIKKHKKLFLKIIFILIVFATIFFIWDMLTPVHCSRLTILPWNVDWNIISLSNIDVNTYIQTLLSALLGLLFTILVVEILLKRLQERQLEEKRKLQFANISKIIKITLFRYHKAALSISYNFGKIPEEEKIIIPIDFAVLSECFLPQQFVDEPLFQTKIEFYSKAVDDLNAMVMNILFNVDLSENNELFNLLTEYVNVIQKNNPCSSILGLKDSTFVKNGLDLIKEIEIKTITPQNICYPFLVLKELIEYHEKFFTRLFKVAPEFNWKA